MYRKMQESGLTEINLFICILVILGQYPMFSIPELPWSLSHCVCVCVCVCSEEWLQCDGCQIPGILLLPECPYGSPAHIGKLQSLITVASLFIDNGRKYFTSPWEVERLTGWEHACVLNHVILVQLFVTLWTGIISVHGILQARILEWVIMPSFRKIFPTQGSSLHLLHWQATSLPLVTLGGDYILKSLTLKRGNENENKGIF